MLSVVTGAFGYTGRAIARRLLERGEGVRTLVGRQGRADPFGGRIAAFPLSFERPDELAGALRGAATLYNTYWIRFPHGGVTFEHAVQNTLTLFGAARRAGVRRIVHLSVTNPSTASPLDYFRGKAVLEEALMSSGLSYAIVRPSLVFGEGDILLNNIAWLLRRFPVFAIPGSGAYRLQPVSVEDVAAIAVDAGRRDDNLVIDAVGPEIYTFEELVSLMARTIGRRALLVHVPPRLALALSRIVGWIVRDVVLTRGELDGLMAGLLVPDSPPIGRTRLSEWLVQNAEAVGRQYASELARHYR
ncbi:MAG: NAD(P)H-binding protein [Armatimonadetes bacterium]|nr:NAD(P)H-binding protein [Armatimonadota bacterium]